MAEANLDPSVLQGPLNVADYVQPAKDYLNSSIADFMKSMPNGGAAQQQQGQGADIAAAGQMGLNAATAAAKLKLQQDNAASAAVWGATPGAPSGTLAILSQSFAEKEKDALARKNMILEKQGTSFFSDPLGWITNQITLPFDIAAFNRTANARDDDLEVIHKLQANTMEMYKNNEVLDQAASAAVLDGQNKIALGNALMSKAQTALEVARLGVSETSVRLAATTEQFNATRDIFQAQATIDEHNIQRQGISIQEQQLTETRIRTAIEQDQSARAANMAALDTTIKNLSIGVEQDKVASLTALNSSLARVASAFKLNPITWQQLQIMGSGAQKDFWEKGIVDPNIQNGRLGYDAASSLETANKMNMPLTPGINLVREKMIGWENDAINAQGGGLAWKALAPEVQHMKIQQMISDRANMEIRSIPSEGGIFSPPPLLKTLQIGQGDESVLATKLGTAIAPLANGNPLYATKADDFMQNALLLMEKGAATPAQMATEINKIYTKILIDNNDVRQYSLLGLKAPVAGIEGFRTSIQLGNAYGSKMTVDMTSPSQVEGALTRMLINRQITNAIITSPGTGLY